nr:acyltransferase [Ruegeria arenilitoris]
MTRGLSLWLDVLRVAATLIVVLSHLAYPRFTGTSYAYLRDWNVGSDAVIVFFVISGLVIAYAADRDGAGSRFVFNRATRLFSVMVPALVLTLAFDAYGYGIDPEAYPVPFYQSHPTGEFLLRGLTFSNEWSTLGRLRLGTNGPLWSLSYEAAYYILFGFAIFTKGLSRVAILIVVIAVAGLNIMLLMPAWLMGVGLWKWVKSGGPANAARWVGWLLVLLGPACYLAGHLLGVPELLVDATAQAFGVSDARWALGFSDEFLWNFLIGIFTAMFVVGIAVLDPKNMPGHRQVRWLAGASFSVYVTHYPALHLLDATVADVVGRDLILLFGSLAIGIVFARYFERPIGQFREWLAGPKMVQRLKGSRATH